MEMRASQVIKGALGGGAKKREEEDWGRSRERREERKGERHLQISIGGKVWKVECHTYLATTEASVEHFRFDLFGHKGHCRFSYVI